MKTKTFYESDSVNFDDAREVLVEMGIVNPTDSQIYDEMSELNALYFEDFFETNSDEAINAICVADIGTWQGQKDGGRVFLGNKLRNIVGQCLKDLDSFSFITNEHGCFTVNGIHHDGSNRFEIRELTDRGVRAFENWGNGKSFKDLSEREIHRKLFDSSTYSHNLKISY